ncbi:MAG: hypothetical protein HY900_34380 [Deltaproteobacteria bacterium]|nr:hypothetical protein [Deltaproteobacteria bacterium]
MASSTRSIHVPLPAPLYDSPRHEARRSSMPATRAAREAIRWWLQERKCANLASSIDREKISDRLGKLPARDLARVEEGTLAALGLA